MKLVLFATLFTVFFSSNVFAQDYYKSIGAGFGGIQGISYKQFSTDSKAVEISVHFRQGGTSFAISRLYHQFLKLDDYDNIFAFYGAGISGGFSRLANKPDFINGKTYYMQRIGANISFFGNFGAEYRFTDKPYVIALSFYPALELTYPLDLNFTFTGTSVSFRYVID